MSTESLTPLFAPDAVAALDRGGVGLAGPAAAPVAAQGETAARGDAFEVAIIEDPAGFEALRDEWDDLLAATTTATVFDTWEWLHTWWRHFGAGRRLAIVTVRRRGHLMAVAPLAERAGGGVYRRLEFLGSGDVGSDYLDILARRGFEGAATATVGDVLARRGAILDLRRVGAPGSTARVIGTDLARRGWHVACAPDDVCPVVDLSAGSWTGYLETLGARHRSNYRRRLRQLTAAFEVTFDAVRSESDRADALATLVRLHNRRWQPRGGSTAFHTGALVRFHEDVTRRILARGWLRLYTLRVGGAPVAAWYGFLFQRRAAFYQAGFDPAWSTRSVGLVTMGLAIERLVGEGATEVDLLHGAEPYKFLWTRMARPLERVEAYPPGPRGWIARRSRLLRRAVTRVARGVAGRARPAVVGGEPRE